MGWVNLLSYLYKVLVYTPRSLFSFIRSSVSCSKMPRGVYERGPGKKNKASGSSSYPAKKYDRGNFSKKPNHGDVIQNPARRDPPNQFKGVWIKLLADLGYGAVGRAPNRAVQYILCLIPKKEIHAAIIRLNAEMPPGAYSPVIYLGFSAWLDLFIKMGEKGMDVAECEGLLKPIFMDMPSILADRTDLDDMLAIECQAGVTYLEEANKVLENDKTFEPKPITENTTSGFTKFIPKEDMELLKNDGLGSQTVSNDNMIRLTLHNCLRFPIISEMAIEWLGEEFDHGLWRSQNFSTLAPISPQAWILIAGLKNDQLIEIDEAAQKMIKLVDKEEIVFPFSTSLFDKRCYQNSGTTIFVKAHMAYPSIKRENNYLHRIWRSYSPYFKCNCTDSEVCKDSITWFDQAIWYALNHLEKIYPKLSPAGRIGAFLSYIQLHLKRLVMAHLVYMQVRDMMIRVTNKLAANSECNLQAELGCTKLVDVCEMMIKSRKFILAKYNMTADEGPKSGHTQSNSAKHEDFMPPRVSRASTSTSGPLIVNLSDNTESIVQGTIDNNDEASVCKGPKPGNTSVRTENMKQSCLKY